MFLVSFHRQRYPWRQIAGHQGSFKESGDPRWILKASSALEHAALCRATEDPELEGAVVGFAETTTKDDKEYLILENVLYGHRNPNIMDVKMGQRTYNALFATDLDVPRADLLRKMADMDPSAPTPEEKKSGVTKRRYMRYRESVSTTATHGFRIDAIELHADGKAAFDRYSASKTVDSVRRNFRRVCRDDMRIREAIVEQLRTIEAKLRRSTFFAEHEVVGSSILHVVGSEGTVACKLLDFGKTVPAKQRLTHDVDVTLVPNTSQEEGYLIGLQALISVWESL